METRTIHSKVLIYTLLTVLAVLVVVPFFWMLLASVKTSNEVFSIPMKLFPKEFQWVNYQTIWDKIPLLTFFKNTFKIAVLTTLLQVLTSCFAAYGFSKVEFRGRDFLFLVSVTTFAVPWQAHMVTQFALISRMGLTDSHLGLILMQAFSGFGVFLIRQFMIGVPNELLEAARIDGLSEYGIFAKVALPLVKPGIATLVIFIFVTIWNDFMGPLIYLNSTRLKTIQLASGCSSPSTARTMRLSWLLRCVGSLRRHFKSACAHNVPVVDWQEYTQCTGSWSVKGTACAAGQQWCRKGEFTFLQGTHLGYLGAGVLVNRRIISIGTRIHVVVDGFYGQGSHVCSQIFHLNPAGTTEIKGNTFFYHGTAAEAGFTVLTPGAALELEETPVSFHYNQLEQGPCVSVSREGSLFTSMVTVIAGYGGKDEERCSIRRVPVIAPVTGRQLEDQEAEAVRILEGGHSWLVVINHRETGTDSEYIGADGCYGLGRVMALDEAACKGQDGGMDIPGKTGTGPRMTVLQW